MPPLLSNELVPLEVGWADLGRCRVSRKGQEIRLSPMEAKLLGYLAQRPGQIIDGPTLLVDVWEYHPSVKSRTAYSTIGRLRKKIERDPDAPCHLLTVAKKGYQFIPLDEKRSPDPGTLTAQDLPTRVGRFELLSVLGEGGMARVFRADVLGPAGFRKPVALKVIRVGDRSAGAESMAMLSREARIGGLLRHPCLVDIYDFGRINDAFYIVMEWVDGWDLKGLLRERGPLPPLAVMELGECIADGLAHAHQVTDMGTPVGLVHRDLKPSNVLISTRGEVKVVDFGVAHATALDQHGPLAAGIWGTPPYQSPEQADGREVDHRSDQFSLGAVLVESVTGQRLFGSATVPVSAIRSSRLSKVVAHASGAVDERVAGLGAVLRRCLAPTAQERFEDAGALRAALLRVGERQQDRRGLRAWLRGETPLTPTRPVRGAPPSEAGPADASRQTNIGVDLDAFVGRGQEMEQLSSRFSDGGRLVTLKGPGGAGKTRLARRYALQVAHDLKGGCWFCDLSEARIQADVVQVVASALGTALGPQSDAAQISQISRALTQRGQTLLVLDNFEQVVAPAAELVRAWLDAVPALQILVTSQERLRLAGEEVLELAPLSTQEGIKLFNLRAASFVMGTPGNDGDGGVLEQLVRRLDCMPLAIELAAARVGVLSPRELLNRLDDRFQILGHGPRAASSKHARLEAVIQWSWDLLTEWEQAALSQLTVFHGGFTMDAAEAVVDVSGWPDAPWVLDVLEALVDKSLVYCQSSGDQPRFNLTESIATFARKQRDDTQAVCTPQHRHARFYAAACQRVLLPIWDEGADEDLTTIQRERENVVNAVAVDIPDHPDVAAICALGAMRLILRDGPIQQGLSLSRTAMAKSGLSVFCRGRVLLLCGELAQRSGNVSRAKEFYTECLDLACEAGQIPLQVKANWYLANIARIQAKNVAVIDHLETAKEQAYTIGQPWLYRHAHTMLGMAYLANGTPDKALENFQEHLDTHVLNRAPDSVDLHHANGFIAHTLGALGRLDEAIAKMRGVVDGLSTTDNQRVLGIWTGNLGELLLENGQYAEAQGCLAQAVDLCSETEPLGRAAFGASHALTYAHLGDLDTAHRLMDEAESESIKGYVMEYMLIRLKRGRISVLAGDVDRARAIVVEAGVVATQLNCQPRSDIRKQIEALDSMLND